ncbi:hypothetical protein [Desulfitobacterium sp.]|uniref:hypothetical protein n=1 Tax=Desulfitobacterium sp. TaxID=49981 RepID=UPI002C001955|nr:hypothetical protein [Desulfitobacterium sp.]HVJ49159.1 hypothetical protein [Desulfitobacterium sp.]
MNEEKSKPEELKRQLWEPAGVISVSDQPGKDYGVEPHESKKRGQIKLEVEEAFHNKGLMENLSENTSKPGQIQP